ncbi:hypothetical protein E0H73_26585 [Kribbella pittospori]|uniref:Uncharacterized protein n=1 Tax=Kribbella pittospori TaxID=722689 RepID=A0A4R0KEP8_9ACTN|nr:hypothetical protein [Kribbella pittospori]TCC58873.1 hypothetical protein E0H73_26585 [Kribbella pittospori]
MITALASMLVAFIGTGTASAQTVAVDDPVGDAGNPNTQSLGSEKEQGYFDIVRAEVSKESGTFAMTMRLAAPVPAAPPQPNGASGMFLWAFALDTQPGSIAGYLYPPGQKNRFEYFVLLSWDGIAFRAFVIDRTPLPSGGEAVTTDVPFSFNTARDEVRFVINPALIGNPATFEWLSVNALRKSHFGSYGLQALDFAPDAGTTTWP